MSATRFHRFIKRPTGETVEAVLFNGSTSQANAIKNWVDGADYHHPGISTCDIRPVEIETADGVQVVHRGTWLIMNPSDSTVQTCDNETFQAKYA